MLHPSLKDFSETVKQRLLWDHPLSAYPNGVRGGGYPVCGQLCRMGGVTRFMCTYALALSLFMFLGACLHYGVWCYLYKFTLTLIQIRRICQNELFFCKEISVCHHEIRF